MDIQIFENSEFGTVRIVEIDENPWLVAKDVAEVLGYTNTRKAISDHVDDDDRKDGVTIRDSIGRDQQAVVINESGFYSLVISSKLPTAKKFKHWVTSDVLPSIRKHGAYMTEETIEKAITSPDFLIKLATELKKEKAKNKALQDKTIVQDQLISELKPKADYVDTILCNKRLTPITHIAKDYGYSARGFNKMLHDMGVQYKVGNQWVLYSKYQGMGYTHSRQYEGITNAIGEVVSNMEWTQKGRLFLYNFLKDKNIVPMIEREMEE